MDLVFLSVSFGFMAFLLYLSAWFAGSETALTHLTVGQVAEMKRDRVKGYRYIEWLKLEMDRSIIAILIGNNIVNILMPVVAALIADSLFSTIGVTIAVGVITFLIIVVGDITPKSIAILDTDRIVRRNARGIYFMVRTLGPLVTVLSRLSMGLIRLRGHKPHRKNLIVSEERIMALATLGEEEGVIKEIEREIIHKVFKFGDKRVEEVMVPISDVFIIPSGTSLENATTKVSESGFTRVPVVRDGRIEGILYGKDLLVAECCIADDLAREPMTVGAGDEITDVFDRMRSSHVHLAVVIGKGDAQVGIISMEDIIEELVGEIEDEFSEVQSGKTVARTGQ